MARPPWSQIPSKMCMRQKGIYNPAEKSLILNPTPCHLMTCLNHMVSTRGVTCPGCALYGQVSCVCGGDSCCCGVDRERKTLRRPAML